MTKNKTFKTLTRNGREFNFLALPDTNFFKFEIINNYGSNVEKAVKAISEKNVYGISHLIEHLSFKSTKDFTTEEFLKVGKNEGVYNAGTHGQYISYWFKTIAENKDLAIKYVCNVALNDLTKISQKEFDIEKSVVYNEAKQAYDDSQMMFYRNYQGALVGYEKEDNTIGRPETIETFSLQDTIDVKNVFLNSGSYTYNIIYDSLVMNEDEIIEQIELELSRFDAPKKGRYQIADDEYKKYLKFPRVGEFKLDNDSEQAMTNITIDVIDNTLVSDAALYYLSNLADNTSLDDVIRQKNGLTYSLYFFMDQISYKPYASFLCDVSVGNEQKLIELFIESINASANEFNEEKYEQYMKAAKLKRVTENLNLEAYDIWFYFNSLQAKDLDPVRDLLAENIEEAYDFVNSVIISYEKMKEAIENVRSLVNDGQFGKVTN